MSIHDVLSADGRANSAAFFKNATSHEPTSPGIAQFLSALFAGCPDEPVALIADNQEKQVQSLEEIDSFAKLAGSNPVYVSTTAGQNVAFLYAVHENVSDPEEWTTYTLAPTAVLHKEATLITAYALEVGVAPSHEVEALALSMGGEIDEPIPTPGANGWTLIHLDAEAFHTPDAINNIFDDSDGCMAESQADAGFGSLLDARLLTPFDLDAPELQQELVISTGANFKSTKWKNDRMSVAKLIAILARHPIGRQKDGPGFVLGEIVGDNRRKQAVTKCYGVGLDIDVGMPGHEIDAALAELGCLALRYTTFSHGKTTSKVNRDKIVKWCGKNDMEFGNDAVLAFLKDQMRWDARLLDQAEYVGDSHDPEGLMACINHPPMEKHRIVMPLSEAFDPTKVAKTHAEGMKMWATVCRALARQLGDLPMDNSAVDPSRLFYFPRHADKRPHETTIFGGPLLDWHTLDLDGEGDQGDMDNFDQVLAAEVEQNSRTKARSKTDDGKKLGRWSSQSSNGFQIVAVIHDLADDRIRTAGSSKIDIECPFDEDHSNAGDPDDRGCFAVNAGDGPSDIFTIKCQHDSCQGKTNLDFLGKMLRDEWFSEEVLADPDYNALVDNESTLRISQGDARRDYSAQTAALTKDSTDEEIEAAAAMIAAAELSVAKTAHAIEAFAAALKIGKVAAKAIIRTAIAARQIENAASIPAPAESAAPTWYRPPPAERGKITLRMHSGRRWMFNTDTPVTTLFTLNGGIRHPDRGETGDCALSVTMENEYGAPTAIDVQAADLVRGKGSPALEQLRAAGLCFSHDGESWLTSYLRETQPVGALHYDRAGVREGAFILPTGEALLTNCNVGLSAQARLACKARSGTLEAWKEGAEFICASGGHALQAALVLGAVGPLVDLGGFDTPIFSFEGTSSAAKSTGQKLGIGLWAEPKLGSGLFISINASDNALERPLEQASGTYLALDEDKQIVGGAEKLEKLAFMIQAGTGKRRRLPRGGEQRMQKWATCVSFSGETGLGQKLTKVGIQAANGLSARVVTINVDDAPDLTANWSKVVQTHENFGHAGPAYIQHLADNGWFADPALLKAAVEERVEVLARHGMPGDIGVKLVRLRRRQAGLVALLWTAAEEMKSAHLLPECFDAETMALTVWEGAQESDIAPRDSVMRSIDTLRENIAARLNVTICRRDETYIDGTPRHLYRELQGSPETLDHKKFIEINAARKNAKKPLLTSQEIYLIRAGCLSDLAGATSSDRTLRKELVRHDIAIPVPGSKKNEIAWDGFPGHGRGSFIVLRRDAIDYSEPAAPFPVENTRYGET